MAWWTPSALSNSTSTFPNSHCRTTRPLFLATNLPIALFALAQALLMPWTDLACLQTLRATMSDYTIMIPWFNDHIFKSSLTSLPRSLDDHTPKIITLHMQHQYILRPIQSNLVLQFWQQKGSTATPKPSSFLNANCLPASGMSAFNLPQYT